MRKWSHAEDTWLLEHKNLFDSREELTTAFVEEYGYARTVGAIRNRIMRLHKGAAKGQAVPRTPVNPKPKLVEKHIAVVLSDVHHGSRVVDQSGAEIFNSTICESRIQNVPQQMFEIAEPGSMDGALVLLVGDIVDGEGIYPTHGMHVEQAVCDQVAGARAALWNMLEQLSGAYGPVRVCAVMGNHGRASKVADERSNWDIMCYQQLQLQASISELPVSVDIGYREGAVFTHLGHELYLRHVGIKHDGTHAQRGKMGSWLEQHAWDLLVCGHWHMPGLLSYNGRPVLRNGAVQPQTDYGEKLGYRDANRQFVFGMDTERPIRWLSWVEW